MRPVELQWHQLWVTRTTNIQCCQTQIIITTAWQDKILHCRLGFLFSSFSFWFCITIHKSCLCWSTQLGLPHRWIITCWKFMKFYDHLLSTYIEDITWPHGDTKFLFECWKIFHEWAQRTSEIFFSTREEKFRISKRPCNILFII